MRVARAGRTAIAGDLKVDSFLAAGGERLMPTIRADVTTADPLVTIDVSPGVSAENAARRPRAERESVPIATDIAATAQYAGRCHNGEPPSHRRNVVGSRPPRDRCRLLEPSARSCHADYRFGRTAHRCAGAPRLPLHPRLPRASP